jgi:hypothetical protein
MGPRQSPSIAIAAAEATVNALRENLWRASRALNLQRLAGGYRQTLRGFEATVAKTLNVELFLYRDSTDVAGSPCRDAPAAQNAVPKKAVRIVADTPPELRHCDIVYVAMRNAGKLPIDVTLLYIEAEAQIQCFNGWGKARIDPGEVRDRVQGFRIVTVDKNMQALPVGRERLMVIGVEKAARDTLETTFCHLAQASLDSARETGRRSASTPFVALMEEAGLAATPTRGFTAVGPEELSNVVMRTFSWDVRDSSGR